MFRFLFLVYVLDINLILMHLEENKLLGCNMTRRQVKLKLVENLDETRHPETD